MTDGGSREAHSTFRRLRHEMRTALGQIMGYSEMLQEEAEDRELEEMGGDLQKIRTSAQRLLSMVDQIFRPDDEGAGASVSSPEDPGEAQRSTATRADAAPDPSSTGATGVTSGALLVVDDDENNRDILSRRLERVGYRVTTAEHGAQALQLLAEGEFDLVLLDVMMPGIDGLEVLERIRKTRSMSDLPVIMATALAESEDTVAALKRGANDYVVKPFDIPVVLARVATQLTVKRAVRQVENLARELQIRNAFIRRVLGRYVSDEIATSVLENPDALDVRGEKRRVSILMTDLRGFTSLTESLPAIDVVRVLNNYLGIMAEVIQSHGGTIDEFIGDAILALFGAPLSREDDTARAVTCALAMQLAIRDVNERSRKMGLPEVEMGVGIATGDVIVGNIGSERRAKYGAVGSPVNLAARVESYTLGGEILICPTTLEAAGAGVEVAEAREVRPKGFEEPILIHRVVGIEGGARLERADDSQSFVELKRDVAVRISRMEGKAVEERTSPGRIQALSPTSARVVSDEPMKELSNLRIQLLDESGEPIPGTCYGKVVAGTHTAGDSFVLRFTSRSAALDGLMRRALSSRGS